jgi:hypothetical protein
MKLSIKILKLTCLLLICMLQASCGLLEIPIDLLSSAVGTAVSAGIAAAPYAAPFFM